MPNVKASLSLRDEQYGWIVQRMKDKNLSGLSPALQDILDEWKELQSVQVTADIN